MLLKDLIKSLDVVDVKGDTEIEISNIKTDSNLVTQGSLFICLKGQDYDGHNFISQAENYGAVAIITESEVDTRLVQVIVKNSRIAMSVVAAEFYGHADNKMKLVSVVGTNGKTTSAYLINSLLNMSDITCGLIGTLGVFYRDKYVEPTLTTPDPIELHRIFATMYANGVEVVVMEVSAHAVWLDKIYGLHFDVAIFTNFSQDHLDFFKDMESYKNAKLKFFKSNQIDYVVANSDDEVGREITSIAKKTITYGIQNPADVFAIKIRQRQDGVSFVANLFDCIQQVKLNMLGRFNVYNALAAATAAAIIGCSPNSILTYLSEIKGVSGRLECVYRNDYSVFVDYAHTPDGLEKVLQTLKKACKGKLISVFGCGGNRDQDKREKMGRISGKLADFTVITSDNPRFEEPMDIINKIEQGVLNESRNYVSVEDRAEAIEYAIKMANIGDVILIAGKGSEKYQEILGIKNPFNDKDIVLETIRRIEG